jgi:oligosaccharide translocation protein RFT1
MIVRILSRVIDFVLNILVLRNIDPKIYGLTTHLGLLSNFSLFYLKVCLKQAYQRRVSIESVKANQETILLSARNMVLYFVELSR